jgi:hypothetical protein
MNLPEALEKLEKLEQENRDLRKRCEQLEKRLRVYESPHVPSSKRIIKKAVVAKPKKKRGAPAGHKGATRETLVADDFVDVKPEACPSCGRGRIKILKEDSKIVEDVEIVKKVTEFHFYECVCKDCGKNFMSTHPDLPVRGNFGPNISSIWNMLHYYGTIPFERLSIVSKNCFSTPITPAGLHNTIYRTAGVFKPHFERIEKNVSKSKNVKSDETSYSYNGEKWWLWNISSNPDTLVLLRNSRGSKILKEVLGEFLDGVLTSDCFSAYGKFKAREYQKCWGHVLDDAEDLAKHDKDGEWLYAELGGMYAYIKKAKKKGRENTPSVKAWTHRATKKILSWSDTDYGSKALKNLVLRMCKHKDHWFTCLKYADVEPTNNGSERDIRKNVLARKISGAHRSEQGMRCREIMMSVLLTLQKKGVNPFEFVLTELKNHNLGLPIAK